MAKKAVAKKNGAANGHTEATGAAVATSAEVDYAQVAAIIEERVAPLEAKLDAILEAIGQGPNGRPVGQTITDAATALHDSLQKKMSNVYFNTVQALSEDGPAIDEKGNLLFSFVEDGSDEEQALMDCDEPIDVISFYLDQEEEEGEEEEVEE